MNPQRMPSMRAMASSTSIPFSSAARPCRFPLQPPTMAISPILPSSTSMMPALPPQEPQLPVLDLTVDHGLTDDQIRIVKTLEGRTMQVDDIIDETQIPTRQVLSALTMLEIDQIVTQSSGKRFSLAVTLA